MDMRWNLDNLYRSFESEEFVKDLTDIDKKIENLSEWSENNLNSGKTTIAENQVSQLIEKYLRLFSEIKELYLKLSSFAELTFSVDASNDSAKKYTEILEQKLPGLTKITVLFSRWISGIEGIDTIISNSKILKEYSFYLTEIIESTIYLLSDKEEILAAKLKTTGSNAWSQLWNILTSTVKVDIEIDGEKKELPLPAVRNMANDSDQRTRKKAFESEIASYSKFSEAAAAALNGVKGEVITMANLRGYESPLDMTLKNSRMDRETLDAMFSAIKEFLPVFRRYFTKKAELLGHKNGLPFYDLFAPMGSIKQQYTYSQAREFIVDKFRDFSNSLADFADYAFGNHWIDAEQREGKRGGAFCENLHTIGESRIMSNFDGSFSGVTTLAHELGHGYHGHCLKGEKFLNSDYPMPLAETASIFCETLIINAAIKTASREEAFTLLENSIQGDAQVIVDIYSRFLFESELFSKRKEASLSVEELKTLMTSAQKESYGEGLDQNYLHPYMWACKPHYYYADFNFYNFPYAFGLLFAKGLYAEYIKQGDSFLDMYDKLLKETGKNKISDITAMVGIEVRSPEFWKSSLELIKLDIDKFITMEGN